MYFLSWIISLIMQPQPHQKADEQYMEQASDSTDEGFVMAMLLIFYSLCLGLVTWSVIHYLVS